MGHYSIKHKINFIDKKRSSARSLTIDQAARTIVLFLLIASFVFAPLSSACAFLSGSYTNPYEHTQKDFIEICTAFGIKKIPLSKTALDKKNNAPYNAPYKDKTPHDNTSKNHGCLFCYSFYETQGTIPLELTLLEIFYFKESQFVPILRTKTNQKYKRSHLTRAPPLRL